MKILIPYLIALSFSMSFATGEPPRYEEIFSNLRPQYWQNVKLYDGSDDFTKKFVDEHEGPVGCIYRYGKPFGTGTLISDNLFLTVSHCAPAPAYWNKEKVYFNYQIAVDGSECEKVGFIIESVVESGYFDGGDWGKGGYAICKLQGSPGKQFGIANVESSKNLKKDDLLVLIHHTPSLLYNSDYRPKQVSGGRTADILWDENKHIASTQNGYIQKVLFPHGYGDGGSSGTGILNEKGNVIGVLVNYWDWQNQDGTIQKNPNGTVKSSGLAISTDMIFQVSNLLYDKYLGDHEVIISSGNGRKSFMIDKYEVVQGTYQSVMNVNPSTNKNYIQPVTDITYYDALLFCNALSRKQGLTVVYKFIGAANQLNPCVSGKPGDGCDIGSSIKVEVNNNANGYRLPTREEWLYAYRAGTSFNSGYYWGETLNPDYLWYYPTSKGYCQVVGRKKPNNWDIYDMSGNASEWVFDNDPTYALGLGESFDANESQIKEALVNGYKFQKRTRSKWRGFRVVRNVNFPDPAKRYRITSYASEIYQNPNNLTYCLNANNIPCVCDRSNVQVWQFGGNQPNELWKFVTNGDGSFKIVNQANTAELLNVDITGGVHPGSNVQVWSQGNGLEENWTIETAPNNCFYFRPKINPSYYLNVNNTPFVNNAPNITNGSNVQVWTLGGGQPNEKWRLVEVP